MAGRSVRRGQHLTTLWAQSRLDQGGPRIDRDEAGPHRRDAKWQAPSGRSLVIMRRGNRKCHHRNAFTK